MGAALLGFSLMGPQAATASTEGASESAVSSTPSADSAADDSVSEAESPRGGDDAGVDADEGGSQSDDGENSDFADDPDLDDLDDLDDLEDDAEDEELVDDVGDADAAVSDAHDVDAVVDADDVNDADDASVAETLESDGDGASPRASEGGEPEQTAVETVGQDESGHDSQQVTVVAAGSTAGESTAGESTAAESGLTATAVDEPAVEPVPAPPWLAPRRSWSDVIADAIDSWTASAEARIDALAVSEERKVELIASFWNFRRTFLNQAPTVAPVQVTGLLTGPIEGTLGAVDVDGDEIVYRLIRRPRQGTVSINADGTYVYTPGTGFDGVDTFRVIAIDRGFHLNLLSPLRPFGTAAASLINQSAIAFDFNYTDGGAGWTPERRQALEDVAHQLLWYLRVNAPVTLTYDVGLEDEEDYLASAGSDLTSGSAGYWRTVVQHKLISGTDANGSAADGQIYWNFADHTWALGDSVASDEYDFASTALHELIHTLGFLSAVDEPGDNTGRNWTIYDSFLVTVDGARPISPLRRWNDRYDDALTGADGGLYFGGANAIAAYGGLVPLFTPDPFSPGSSVSHLDDVTFTGSNHKIMNARGELGPSVRALSDVELGILADLGYQVAMPESPPYAAAALVFVLLGRRRRKGEPVHC